ncbi:hypothetical protein LCGC14_2625630, partial [marine sediment metagenome]
KDGIIKKGIIEKRDLNKICNDLEKEQEKTKKKEIKKEKEPEIPEKYYPKIEKFLHSENKFTQIEEILDSYITGERNNKMLTFILLSGSYFNLYSIIAFIGSSAGGKSFIIKNVLESTFSKKDFKYITGGSDRYLIYLAKSEQNFKILFFNEAQRNKQIIEQMKDFGDDGIVYGTVERDKVGNYQPLELNLGKCSIIITTTDEFVNIEFLNRAWRLEPIETSEQSKEIVEEDYKNKKKIWEHDKKGEEINEKAKVVKFTLRSIKKDFDGISIPFTKSLIKLLNLNTVQVRRDKDKLTDLIKRITAWNFKIRSYINVNNKKYILSHPNDLKTAMFYASDIFINMTKNLTPEKIKIINRINDMTKKEKKTHRVGEILEQLKIHKEFTPGKKSLSRRLRSLIDLGYLEDFTDPKDKRFKIYKSLTEDIKSDQDIKKIIANATNKYVEFIKEIKKDKDITLN